MKRTVRLYLEFEVEAGTQGEEAAMWPCATSLLNMSPEEQARPLPEKTVRGTVFELVKHWLEQWKDQHGSQPLILPLAVKEFERHD